ncbi:ribonucleotide-diphosphate reductase subunit beta [Sediminibacterium goheungense]|uniref:ribonucleoside-diphosphate reductase n=1 Tax=Sediminibacterium goheungense TaxID=1086393 RepID=A0A4R6J513_9BACT|nr:ribonucleotide-diphosphate reductase subunit beta [Sediminibacterium goheungense]TDO29396.1 ribonucleoside-diphosphate reductase beta chain [Sediminibacterium goheungense]
MGLFDKRNNYKPFEYPEVLQFTEAINKSFWVHTEVDFTADTQDFHSHLNPAEQNAIKNSLLTIAQIEVAVKSFWGNLYHHFPKPELNGLGSTFAECEFRHSEAYSRLLEVLGYNDEYEKLIEVPIIKQRFSFLSGALKNVNAANQKEYIISFIVFTILIENVSLFSQFAVVLSFTRFKGLMKNVSNIIAWTSVDEQLHANAGIYLINKLREEYPNMFDDALIKETAMLVHDFIEIEEQIIDWIFVEGPINTIDKTNLLNFIKFRADESLRKIDFPQQFFISTTQFAPMKWFEEEVFANSLDDFFAKRPVDYTKHDKSITANDLF